METSKLNYLKLLTFLAAFHPYTVLFANPVNKLSNPDHWIAVVGDSATTGAASDPGLQPNWLNLLGLLNSFLWQPKMTDNRPGNSELWGVWIGDNTLPPPTRVLYSKREFQLAQQDKKVGELNLGAKASLKTDVEEYSFGYMLGRKLGVKEQDIVFVGQNGTRVSSLPVQFERIFEMQTSTLPPVVLVSYNANDFCSEEALAKPLPILKLEFKITLEMAWQATEPFLIPHRRGTQIIVLSPIEVANVLTNTDVLAQKIDFSGGPITCGELRTATTFTGLKRELQTGLQGMCSSVLKTNPTDHTRVDRLRDIQIAFREAWREVLTDLNRTVGPQKNISWQFAESVANIDFKEGDVANDCFHPSRSGAEKIMEAILQDLPLLQ